MNTKFKNFVVTEKKLFIIALLVILGYFSPYFILGENANILIHDNLDAGVTWVKILLDNNAMFASPQTIIPTALNGIPLSDVYPYYDLSLIVFKIFGIYWGYVVNKLLMSIIGFFGMYLLLKNHFVPNPQDSLIIAGTSLLYGLLPYWSFQATVSGLPFVFYALLNIRQRDYRFYNWLIIILYAFYSSIVLAGVFLIITMFFIFLYDTIISRKINWSLVVGLSVLVGAYLISQFPTISGFLEGGISHRKELVFPGTSFIRCVKDTITLLVTGQYHAQSLHQFIFFPILILLFYSKKLSRRIRLIVAFIVITSVIFGFINYHITKPIVGHIMELVPLQLQRFHFLHPMLWYILLAVTLTSISSKNRKGKIISQFILLFQFIFITLHHEVIVNRDQPTFKEFYSEGAFMKIKQTIDKPIDTYKVISVGIHPAIAQYNGFYTLDGYFVQYPLSYKHQFRKIIEDELERNEDLKLNFDTWGSRCYAFSSELGANYLSTGKIPIDSLNYNYELLEKLGGQYIFSTSPINESINHKLKLLDAIQHPESYWKIYVYEVDNTQQNKK